MLIYLVAERILLIYMSYTQGVCIYVGLFGERDNGYKFSPT